MVISTFAIEITCTIGTVILFTTLTHRKINDVTLYGYGNIYIGFIKNKCDCDIIEV